MKNGENNETDLKIKLSGLFNVYNSLCAISGAIGLGVDLKTIKERIEKLHLFVAGLK